MFSQIYKEMKMSNIIGTIFWMIVIPFAVLVLLYGFSGAIIIVGILFQIFFESFLN